MHLFPPSKQTYLQLPCIIFNKSSNMGSTTSTLLNIFIALFLLWLVVLIISIYTLFRRRDILLPVKAFWAAVLFLAPVVGLIFYLIYGVRKNTRSDITRY